MENALHWPQVPNTGDVQFGHALYHANHVLVFLNLDDLALHKKLKVAKTQASR
jgi:hypothetical protein